VTRARAPSQRSQTLILVDPLNPFDRAAKAP